MTTKPQKIDPPMSVASSTTHRPAAWAFWLGWVLTVLPALALVASGVMKVMKLPMVIEGLVTKAGFPESSVVPIGIVEIACAILLVIPQTAVVGGILVAAYLGGAVATHVHEGEPVFGPILFAVVAWLGLLLKDPRLQQLLPFVRRP